MIVPADGVCGVWVARPTPIADNEFALLHPTERERLAAYARPADRDRFSTGCLLLRRVLGAHLDLRPADVPVDRACLDCDRPHGKPRVLGDPVEVSLSHSGDRVVLAAHRSAPVGVDVEQINPGLNVLELADQVLTPAEQAALAGLPPEARPAAFARYWVRKEALVKATGAGLRTALTGITVSGPDCPPAVLAWDGGPAQLIDLDVGTGYAAAAAVLSASGIAAQVILSAAK